MVAFILARPEFDANKDLGHGWTALHSAIPEETAVVRLFLAHPDLDVNKAHGHAGTALCLAARCNHAAIVELLLARLDVKVNTTDATGNTALYKAAERGFADTTARLLEHPDMKVSHTVNLDGWTALDVAADRGHADVVKLLLKHPYIEVDHVDTKGCTALDVAFEGWYKAKVVKRYEDTPEGGYAEGVELLLAQSDIDVNKANDDRHGETALCKAARLENTAKVMLLLEHPGIKVDHVNKEGHTARDVAAMEGHEDVVKLLEEYNAD